MSAPIPAKKQLFHSSLLMPMSALVIVNRYLFDPVAGGASSIFEIPVASTKGNLIEVKCQCNSANYDLYINPFPVVDTASIMVIYDKKAVNKVLRDVGLSILWSKYSMLDVQHSTHLADVDQNLYVQIDNKGAASGDIYFELAYSVCE